MRCVVGELIEPLIKKAQNHASSIDDIEQHNTFHAKQLRELEAIVCKGSDRITFVDELIRKVDNIALKADLADVRGRQNFENCMKLLSTFQGDTRSLREDLQRSDDKYTQLIEDVDKLASGLSEYQGKIHDEFTRFNDHVTAATKSCNLALRSAEELADNASKLSKGMSQQLPDVRAKLDDVQKFCAKQAQAVADIENSKADLKQTQASLAELSAQQTKLFDCQIKSQKQLNELLRYVDKYLPVQIQTSISSNLTTCLDKRHLKPLLRHDQEILANLNGRLLDTADPSLEHIVNTTIQACLAAEERNTELLLKMKSSGNLAIRPSVSSLANRAYASKGASQTEIAEYTPASRVSSAHRSFVLQSAGASRKNIKIDDNESEVAEYDDEEPVLSVTEGKELKRLVQEAIISKSEFVTHIERQVDNFKGYVGRGDDEVKLYVQVLQGQLETFQNRIEKDLTICKAASGEMEVKRLAWDVSLEKLTNEVSNLSQMQACLVESALIIQSLLTQDEEDKSTMKLTGLKSFPTPTNPTMKLKTECLSCTGQGAMLANAFKIACISYEPSVLSYRNKSFTRPQLLQLLGTLVQSTWNSTSVKPPYDTFTPRAPSMPSSGGSSRRRVQSRESTMRRKSGSVELSLRSSCFPKLTPFQEM